MTEAELFKACREALGYSVRGMADALLVGERSVFRWEADTLDVSGPAWVIISYMLEDPEEYGDPEVKRRLVGQVFRIMDCIQDANKEKRRTHERAHQERRMQKEEQAG